MCVVERHQQARLFKGQSVFVYIVETCSHNVLHHVGAVSPLRQLSITIKTINRPLKFLNIYKKAQPFFSPLGSERKIA